MTPSPAAGRVEVNFHADLTRLIRETRYLDKMGFAVPELALQLALQEPKYDAWLEQLEHMLAHYYQVGEGGAACPRCQMDLLASVCCARLACSARLISPCSPWSRSNTWNPPP